jgi:hypothetical protein
MVSQPPPEAKKVIPASSEGHPSPVDLSFQLFPGGSLGEFNLPRELSTVLSHGKGIRRSLRNWKFLVRSWGTVLFASFYLLRNP